VALTHDTTHASLLPAFRTMLTIRRFEERALALRQAGEIAGSIHLCTGQEAIPAGALEVLAPDDRVVATYRGHGWAIACGIPLDRLMAELCQRSTGINGGRGGSAHLMSPAHRLLGENSIVGAGVPIAAGAALAAQVVGTRRVVAVSVGDGATSQGAMHEALVFAAFRRLPLIVICENNGWSEMTPIEAVVPLRELAARAAGYAMAGATVDGNDPTAVAEAVADAAERARDGGGPTFLEARCHRLGPHYNGDVEHYRPREDREAALAADPLPALRRRLMTAGASDDELSELEREVAGAIDAASAAAIAAPAPDPATARRHVAGPPAPATATGDPPVELEMTYVKAVTEALRRELTARPEVVVYGEDVGASGGIFGASRGLQEEFGVTRVFDSPIAESAILGSALGAALEGLRPVVEIMWGDFLLVALDQLINQAANVRYVSRGEHCAPLVVRTQQGATPGSCAQHSQSLEALLAHVPGLRVGVVATPQDAHQMLRAAIADDDPVVLFESRALYQDKGTVTLGGEREALGGARERRAGGDVALIAWGRTALQAERAAERLAAEDIDATVLDLRWLAPLDDEAIKRAVERTGRVLVAHEANLTGGFGAEIAARIGERHFDSLDAPVRRIGTPDSRIPPAPALQAALLPSVESIAQAAAELTRIG
jgi:2-oxoisovalerate dehydrogenase E1 component